MLTAKPSARRSDGHVDEFRSAQKLTSGGTSETELKLFTASPCGVPARSAATTTTPVAKRPSTARKTPRPTLPDASSPGAGPVGMYSVLLTVVEELQA